MTPIELARECGAEVQQWIDSDGYYIAFGDEATLATFTQRIKDEAMRLPSSYVNAAGISAADMPAAVVKKLDAAAIRSLKGKS